MVITTGNAPVIQQMHGALPFKPSLSEYLIDSSEEGINDTLFYVKHARRLATAEHNNMAANIEMTDESQPAQNQ